LKNAIYGGVGGPNPTSDPQAYGFNIQECFLESQGEYLEYLMNENDYATGDTLLVLLPRMIYE
jgi:hypothetical protein